MQAPVKKSVIKVDTTKVKAGVVVTHKAFGAGQVKGVDGALMVVSFKGVDKKFQFPSAFRNRILEDGRLSCVTREELNERLRNKTCRLYAGVK